MPVIPSEQVFKIKPGEVYSAVMKKAEKKLIEITLF